MSRRRKKAKPKQSRSQRRKSPSEVCKGCGFNPCQDLTLGCESSDVKKLSSHDKYQFCFECKSTQEIQFDANLQEFFCSVCGCTVGDKMIKLPDAVKKGGNSYGYQNNSGYGNSTYVPCDHVGDKVIFEKGGKQLYAANSKGLNEFSDSWGVIIDLASIVATPSPGFVKLNNPKRYDSLRQYTGKYVIPKAEILRLDWPDMSPPAVMPDFWFKLWDILPEKSVIVCQGGHGRTGTCLASFMITVGEMDYYTAFVEVRSKHCEKAIESLSQARYLHGLYVEMLKRKLTESTAKMDLVATAKIQSDLEFAEAHKPKSDDLLGDAETESDVSTNAKGYSNKKSNGNGNISESKQCPSCYTWVDRNEQFNDFWCHKCKKEIKPNSVIDADFFSVEFKDDGKDFEQARVKRVLGVLYLKECMDPACQWAEKEDCSDPDHLAWVKWDDYQYMEARVS